MQGLDQIIMVDAPAFDKYRITYHMEVSDYKRWCHDCPDCAQRFH